MIYLIFRAQGPDGCFAIKHSLTINFASLNRTVHFNGSPINTKKGYACQLSFTPFHLLATKSS